MDKTTRKKKLGGYPATGVVISITLALFVIGLFGLLISFSKQFETAIRENVSFKVYLRSSLSETQRKQVQQNLRAMDFVAALDSPITFVSREQAQVEMAHLGDFQEVLGDNPFKDMFEVRVAPEYHDTTSLNNIKIELEKLSGVLDAVYEQDYLEDINTNFRKISLVLIGLASILLLTVILLINNTLRIALFSQRFLIRSMQLVGARNGFIQRPFLLRASLYGILAGVLASGLLLLVLHYAYQWIDKLAMLHNSEHLFILCGAITVAGILIALFSTLFSIRRYLKMSLDELY